MVIRCCQIRCLRRRGQRIAGQQDWVQPFDDVAAASDPQRLLRITAMACGSMIWKFETPGVRKLPGFLGPSTVRPERLLASWRQRARGRSAPTSPSCPLAGTDASKGDRCKRYHVQAVRKVSVVPEWASSGFPWSPRRNSQLLPVSQRWGGGARFPFPRDREERRSWHMMPRHLIASARARLPLASRRNSPKLG